MDPGLVWDALLASKPRPENTTASASASRPIRLRLDPEPTATHLPRKPRRVNAIPEELRSKIRSLVSGESPWPLTILGPAGTGKTCAALCLLDHASGEYHAAGDLCDLLIRAQDGRLSWTREGHGSKIWPEDVWRTLERAALVVLDEIGTRERVSDFAYGVVKRVLDSREGRPLVCLSNLGMDRLAQVYDDRVASRLAAGTVVLLDGEDRRLERHP
jgi:DNA replication protein DnaC